MAPSIKENIIFGGEIPYSFTRSFKSLGHYVLAQYKTNGENVTIINASTGEEYTRKYIHDRVVRLVYILQHLGIKKGDVVGICDANSIDFAVTLFSTIALGAIAAPFNMTYNDRELNHVVNLSKPKVIFCSRGPLSTVLAVAKRNTFIERVVFFGDRSPSPLATALAILETDPEFVSYSDFEPPAADKTNDVVLIVCSSGTTGLPKGVRLTQMNILSFLEVQWDFAQHSKNPMLSVIPWFHSLGCITLIASSSRENSLVFLPKFEGAVFLAAIEKYQVAIAYMVPPLTVFLAKHSIVDKYDLSSLLVVLCGAAPLSKETVDAVKNRIGIPIILQGYGLSETTLSTLIQDETHCKPGSVGTVKLGLWAKIIATETGVALGPNQRGELCFKGPNIMKGYIGDDVSTSNTIKDGWLHTGDIGYYDDDLEFFIVDRIKELIKYNGFQVAPAEIEAILLSHPKIKDAAVIGKPDESFGELPMAFIVKQDKITLTAEEVIRFVADNTSKAKNLRGGVRFLDEIPKNPSGKILRRVLRDNLKEPRSKL